MKRYLAAICALVLFSYGPLWAQVSVRDSNSLVITEVFTGSEESGWAEFVEIYNPNDIAYSLECFDLQYATSIDEADEPTWHSKVQTPGFHDSDMIAARGFGLLATDAYLEEQAEADDEEFNAETDDGSHMRSAELARGLVDGNRSLRLVEYELRLQEDDEDSEATCSDEAPTVHDLVGWGADAPASEDTPFQWLDESDELQDELPPGTSMKRLVNEDGLFVDTDVNADNFLLSDEPKPQLTLEPDEENANEEPDQPDQTDDSDENEDEGDSDTEDDTSEDTDEDDASDNENNKEDNSDDDSNDSEDGDDKEKEEKQKQTYTTVEISELLVDPEQPLTDSDDEFVELRNPHNTAVDLSGYTIQAGSKLQYSHEVDDVTLVPGEYKAFTSDVTGLRLANSGGRAQVLDPNGAIVANLLTYPEAETGESYAKVEGSFVWTDNVTPNKANQSPTPEPQEEASTPPATSSNDQNVERSYPKLLLNEFLPDPASPRTDSDDEFVELYNPNSFRVDASGYVLRSGSRGTTTHTIDSLAIGSQAHVAFFASDSNLTLSNSGITVILEDPSGAVIDSRTYPEAKEGQSWAKTKTGQWQWTTTTTPATQNTFTQESSKSPSDGRVLAASEETAASDAADTTSNPATVDATRADYRIIVGAAILALLYGLYDFRHDVYAYIRKFRDHLSNR